MIVFQKKMPVKDSMGQTKMEFENYKKVWATVKPFKSSEAPFVGKLRPEVTHRFYIRFRRDITADMRILYAGKVFEIAGPPIDLNDGHELLEIQAEEGFENEQYGV